MALDPERTARLTVNLIFAILAVYLIAKYRRLKLNNEKPKTRRAYLYLGLFFAAAAGANLIR